MTIIKFLSNGRSSNTENMNLKPGITKVVEMECLTQDRANEVIMSHLLYSEAKTI